MLGGPGCGLELRKCFISRAPGFVSRASRFYSEWFLVILRGLPSFILRAPQFYSEGHQFDSEVFSYSIVSLSGFSDLGKGGSDPGFIFYVCPASRTIWMLGGQGCGLGMWKCFISKALRFCFEGSPVLL